MDRVGPEGGGERNLPRVLGADTVQDEISYSVNKGDAMIVLLAKGNLWGIVMKDESYGTVMVLKETQTSNGDMTYVPEQPLGFLKSGGTVVFDSDVEMAPEIVKAILGK